MNILWTMFLSGNGLFLLFICIEHWKKDLFSQRMQCAILKTAVLFSVFPMVWIKFSAQILFDEWYPKSNAPYRIDGGLPLIVRAPDALHSNRAFKVSCVVFALWLSVALFILVRYLIILAKLKSLLLDLTYENTSEDVLTMVAQQRKELKLKRKIEIRVAKEELSPFTLGIVKPVVVIPNIQDLEKQKLLITHELYHIKRWDTLMKLVGLIVKTIYWFNPLSHKLYARLDMAMECSCDELVIRHMDKEQRKNYAFFIVDMAEVSSAFPEGLTVSLSNDKEKLKERGKLIMRGTKKTSKYAFLLSVGLIFVSSIPILASEQMQVIACNEEQCEFFLVEGEGNTVDFLTSNEWDSVEKIDYLIQFIDEAGNIYNVDSLPAREACQNHHYVNGQIRKHIKNSNGSCEVKYYEGKRCSVCGHTVYGRLTDSEYHETCPH